MIFITGDTHIPTDVQKLNSKRFPEQKELTERDYLIICGDFGGVFDNSNEEKYWLKWLSEKNFTTLFVDGNHENHKMLNEDFPVVDFCGGKAHKIRDKIYHLMRGEVFVIDGRKIFAFGGAASHDIGWRTENVNWWRAELPTNEEMNSAIKNLSDNGWRVDTVISHCASNSVQHLISPEFRSDILTDFFESIEERLCYDKWFFGHYHIDRELDERHTALFERIFKL